ncbi:hypothetical protein [Fulvimarina sp. MAC3]|uniref:hypothetical protein n=1 Tax=Fulvimarina sp. MAC3 TaxID=3148887 RepID=UPI0031FBC9C1
MITRIRRYLAARRELADRIDVETTAYLNCMSPPEAWFTARISETNRPQDGRLWYLVRREITKRTGYVHNPDTATRYLEGR